MITKRDIAKLEGLTYLYALSLTKSKKEVAEKLGTSVDTVNKYISELETELKTHFLVSNGRGTVITPEGHRIIKIADDIIKAIRSLDDYEDTVSSYSGIVRLGMIDSLSNYISIETLSSFLEKYPKITIETNIADSLPDMNTLEIDLGVSYEIPQNGNLLVIDQHIIKCGLFASQKYIDKYGQPQDMEDLFKNHYHCCKYTGKPRSLLWQDFFKHLEHVAYQTNSIYSMRRAIDGGVGIGICPITDGYKNLVHINKIKFSLDLDLYILAHKDTKDIPRINIVIEHIKKHMQIRDREQAEACKNLGLA